MIKELKESNMKVKTHRSHQQNSVKMKKTPICLNAHKRTRVMSKYKVKHRMNIIQPIRDNIQRKHMNQLIVGKRSLRPLYLLGNLNWIIELFFSSIGPSNFSVWLTQAPLSAPS